MPSKYLQHVYQYHGSVADLSGNLLLSAFDGPRSGELEVEDSDGDDSWDRGEPGSYGGDPAQVLGSGTATVGVSLPALSLLGLPLLPPISVSAGSSVEVNAFTSGGDTYFNYPDGEPAALLDGLVSDLRAEILANLLPGADMEQVLDLLGVPDLETYLEQNAVLHFDLGVSATMPICFTAGTRILCRDGYRRIEQLRPGDRVLTRDDGFQPICWIAGGLAAAPDAGERREGGAVLRHRRGAGRGEAPVFPRRRRPADGRARDLLPPPVRAPPAGDRRGPPERELPSRRHRHGGPRQPRAPRAAGAVPRAAPGPRGLRRPRPEGAARAGGSIVARS
jgi:hypothetical protein